MNGKLLGDAKSLEQEIDEYINRIDSQDKEIERLENSIDTNKLDPKDKQNISVDGPQYDNKYIEENGKIYNTVGELNKYNLESTDSQRIARKRWNPNLLHYYRDF